MSTQTKLDLPPGCAVTGTLRPGFETILTREAMEFVADLARRYGPRVAELLARREARQKEIDAGKLPDFLPETRAILLIGGLFITISTVSFVIFSRQDLGG